MDKTDQLIGKYCGDSISPIIKSKTSNIYLHFKTDSSGAYDGFRVKWKALEQPKSMIYLHFALHGYSTRSSGKDCWK